MSALDVDVPVPIGRGAVTSLGQYIGHGQYKEYHPPSGTAHQGRLVIRHAEQAFRTVFHNAQACLHACL